MSEAAVYIGTKIVVAEPATNMQVFKERGDHFAIGTTVLPGYRVVYEDGYVSWSPKDVFERCYRRITDAEKALLG